MHGSQQSDRSEELNDDRRRLHDAVDRVSELTAALPEALHLIDVVRPLVVLQTVDSARQIDELLVDQQLRALRHPQANREGKHARQRGHRGDGGAQGDGG